jgi:MFS family permease
MKKYLDRTGLYNWWVVAVLMLAMLVSFIDRQIIALVVEPMKHDLDLSDTEAGWLYSGFAIFYAIAGVPIAWLADRKNRKVILSVGISLWTFFTMCGGVLQQFWSIFLARVGVGVGEATMTPCAHSIIGDLMPKRQLPLAIAIFQGGAILGTGLAFIFGGLVVSQVRHAAPIELPFIGTIFAWQVSFFIVALPGIFVLFLMSTIREPIRKISSASNTDVAGNSSLRYFYRVNRRAILCHHIGFASLVLMGYAFVFWTPSFFERAHNIPAEDAAVVYGLIFLVAGSLGTVLSASFAQKRMAQGDHGSLISTAVLGAVGLILSIVLIQTADSALFAFLFYVPALFFLNTPFGLSFGALPLIAPPDLRARVVAIYMLVVSAGNALGPPVTGWLTDTFFTSDDGIMQSLVVITLFFGIVGIAFLLYGKSAYAESVVRMMGESGINEDGVHSS